MNQHPYDIEANAVANQLPPGPRLVVIGSSSFWGKDSSAICEAVGVQLATLDDLVLITGGVPGVGETVGRAFGRARQQSSKEPAVFHILPHGSSGWDYGVTLFGGTSMYDRREILGRLSRLNLAIEGGPGTAHEAKVVEARDGLIVPIGRTGGVSEIIYNRLKCPLPQLEERWKHLGDRSNAVEQVAESIRAIVQLLLRLSG